MLSRKLALTVVATLVLAGAIGGSAAGAATQENSDSSELTQILGTNRNLAPTAAELEDLTTFAEQEGESLDSVVARFNGQEEFSSAVDILRAKYPDAFSQARFEPGEGYRASVRFVGELPIEAKWILDALPLQVRVSSSATASSNQLDELLRVTREAVAKFNGVEAASSRLKDGGTIEVSFSGDSSVADVRTVAHEIAYDTLGRASEVNIQVLKVPGLGVRSDAVIGGNKHGGCTAAFTVTSFGLPGISTAAHCANTTFAYGGQTATWVTSTAKADGDVQWSSLSGGSVTNKFRYKSDGSTRSVTGSSNPIAGTAVCRWGFATGNNCGTVSDDSYCDPSGYCKLFTVEPPNSEPGDSGGPYYYGKTAKGIHRGNVTVLGINDFGIATRISSLAVMGAAIKLAP